MNILCIDILPDGHIFVRPEDVLCFGKGIPASAGKEYYFVSLKSGTVVEFEVTLNTIIKLKKEFELL